MDPQTVWLFGLASMLALFIIIYYKESKLRLALVYSLLWGKILATVYMLLHLDIPVFQVYMVKQGIITARHVITANMLVFTSFLLSNTIAIAWPELKRELGIRPGTLG